MPEPDQPPVREFADRATLWLLESPENLRQLLRLVATEIAERLDFHRAERINRSFIPGNLHKRDVQEHERLREMVIEAPAPETFGGGASSG